MSFSNFLASQGKSKTTIKINENCLLQFITWCDKNNIEAQEARYQDILLYVKSLQNTGIQQSTVRIHVNSLQNYFKWLVSIHRIKDLPTKGIEVRGVVRRKVYPVIPYKELEALYPLFKDCDEYLAGAKEPWLKEKHLRIQSLRIAYGFMLWQGMGAREICTLEVKDVRLREAKVYISGTRQSNERTLDLSPMQIIDLIQYITQTRPILLESNDPNTTQLILSQRGGDWSKNLMNTLIQELRKYDSRIINNQHVFTSVVSHWLKLYNLRQVQYMAGHRFVSSTEAYINNNLDDLKEDITNFHPLG